MQKGRDEERYTERKMDKERKRQINRQKQEGTDRVREREEGVGGKKGEPINYYTTNIARYNILKCIYFCLTYNGSHFHLNQLLQYALIIHTNIKSERKK